MAYVKRRKGDVQLVLHEIEVRFSSGAVGSAVAEGNNASWECSCGERLLGRCYFQFGHDCHTTCTCGALYRVAGDSRKRAIYVRQCSGASAPAAA